MTAATERSDLSRDLIEARTDMFLTFLLGFSVVARAGADDDEIDRLIQASHATVESWRFDIDAKYATRKQSER